MNDSVRPVHDIHALALALQARVDARWQATLDDHADKLADAYARAGDLAYGTYLGLLFRPLDRDLRGAGLATSPALPGDLDRSREWGRAPDETDQERWMWSLVRRADGTALGALVTAVFHDHTRFRVPRAPRVFGVAAGDEAVIAALSAASPDFAKAREFSVEVAEYLALHPGADS